MQVQVVVSTLWATLNCWNFCPKHYCAELEFYCSNKKSKFPFSVIMLLVRYCAIPVEPSVVNRKRTKHPTCILFGYFLVQTSHQTVTSSAYAPSIITLLCDHHGMLPTNGSNSIGQTWLDKKARKRAKLSSFSKRQRGKIRSTDKITGQQLHWPASSDHD